MVFRTAALEIPEHCAPALGALPVAVLQGDHFFAAVRPDSDQHERAQPLVLQADREVDAAGPEVDVVAVGEVSASKRLILGRPALGQAGDGARRQASRLRSQQGRQRVPKIARGQAMQVQQGQHAGEAGRAAQVGRPDRAGEPLSLAVHHPAIIHPRRGHRDRPDPRRDAPRAGRPIAHDHGVADRIALAPMPGDVLLDLELQRGLDHPAGSFPGQLIQRASDRPLRLRRRSRSDKLQHWWRTFLPGWHRGLGLTSRTSPRRVRRLFSSSTTSGYSSPAKRSCD